MSDMQIDLSRADRLEASPDCGRPLGGLLLETGTIEAQTLVDALGRARRIGARTERVLLAEDLAPPDRLRAMHAKSWGCMALDRTDTPPDPELAELLSPATCLTHNVLPWMRLGRSLVLAAADRDGFDRVAPVLRERGETVILAAATEADIEAEIALRHGERMARAAESSVPADESCRDLNRGSAAGRAMAAALAGLCLGVLLFAPTLFFAGIVLLAILSMAVGQVLKLAACLASRRPGRAPEPMPAPPLPEVSILVPLFREERIAGALIDRLARITYPHALLDVILILEAGDDVTAAALDAAELPPWMRVITVPDGPITTKPRALNYALNFARGSIVGVLDAEDAPAPNQIARVVSAFRAAPPEVGCVQGILDFYNPRANWLSRCFTIEYATWFRLVLPGLARLGLAVPLGGTTVYFRRAALERVSGWDAHNVTEDADLGIRLARHGYRTELLATVTREEANNRVLPWIRQRSRWIKGYMLTWAVHARAPRRLWRDLGPWRFLGFHALFLTTIAQALLLPALWSFWLVPFGLPHPLADLMSAPALTALIGLFLTAEAATLVLALVAVSRSPHRGLALWVPTLFLYFPLAAAAALKAAWEGIARPFYWDKTMHGHSPPDHAGADLPES
ncbi:glycosyltransferase [Litorisediminicola beolgyonensis]|uniref:Glycosyltransferase n=1 Tax=Litorisediminicola beolgyonensis TaxID=1173614 RepID=A0ABW3ZH15_9RHOB